MSLGHHYRLINHNYTDAIKGFIKNIAELYHITEQTKWRHCYILSTAFTYSRKSTTHDDEL